MTLTPARARIEISGVLAALVKITSYFKEYGEDSLQKMVYVIKVGYGLTPSSRFLLSLLHKLCSGRRLADAIRD